LLRRSLWDRSNELSSRPLNEAQKIAQPGEDAAEIVANGGEDDVGGIASAALEIAAAEVAFGLQVADHGLDGGSVSQPALDHSEDAALLAGNEDAAWNLRVLLAGLPAHLRENVRARKVRRIVFSIVFRQPSPATLFFKLIEVETKFPFANSILEFYAAKSHCGSQSSKCTLQGRLGSRRSCWPRSKAAEGRCSSMMPQRRLFICGHVACLAAPGGLKRLQCRLITAPPVSASPGTSPGHAFDILQPWRR
jgi:hypothetical protein